MGVRATGAASVTCCCRERRVAVKSPLTPLQGSRKDLEATGRLWEDLGGTLGESLGPRTLPTGMEAGLPLLEACRGARSASRDELEPEGRVSRSTRASLVYIRIR